MECPQCGVQVPGKSLTRNSSYSTMVQCITKIRNILNGENQGEQDPSVLLSILDGVINDENDENEPSAKTNESKFKVNENKAKVNDNKLTAKENVPSNNENVPNVQNEIKMAKESKRKVKSEAPKVKKVKETEIVKESTISKVKRYGLLLTGLSEDQKAIIHFNLQNLTKISGGVPFKIIKDYSSDQVTHIICACAPKSHCPRTLKYLLGIVGKSWIVSFDWILESIEAGKLLNESQYVVKGDEAVRCDTSACEKSRADPGKLFAGKEFFLNGSFIGGGPSKADLTNLIQLAGGIVCKRAKSDTIVITDSQEFRNGQYPYTWLFDSISCYELKIN